MKLSLLGTAGCLDRAAGGPWPLVVAALFQPVAFVKRLIDKNACALPIGAGSVISLFLIAGPVAADPYKWCAVERTGGNNCGFTTIEQCRATVSGIGGFCQPNSFYTGPDKTSAQRSQKQAKREPSVERPEQARRKPPAEHRAQEYRVQEHRAQKDRAQERRAQDRPQAPAPERRVPEDRFQ